MALNVSIDVPTSKDASGAISKGVKKYLEDGAGHGFAHALELVPQDRGTLLQSAFEPEWTSDGALRWGFRAGHAKPQEFGTQPFAPPLDPILDWAERVTGDRGFGYYVHWKIRQEGIDAQPFARPGREKQAQWYKARDIGKFIDEEL